jgi:hypothetical protein
MLWNEEKGKSIPNGNAFRTSAKIGRLRLIRSGPQLYYGFAEARDGNFHYRARYNFGPEDLREIRITASTGGELAAFEFRITDFHLRADVIPGAPAVAPAAAAQVDGPAAVPVAPGRAWLKASLVIAAVILVVAGAVLGTMFFLVRARKATPPPSTKELARKRK